MLSRYLLCLTYRRVPGNRPSCDGTRSPVRRTTTAPLPWAVIVAALPIHRVPCICMGDSNLVRPCSIIGHTHLAIRRRFALPLWCNGSLSLSVEEETTCFFLCTHTYIHTYLPTLRTPFAPRLLCRDGQTARLQRTSWQRGLLRRAFPIQSFFHSFAFVTPVTHPRSRSRSLRFAVALFKFHLVRCLPTTPAPG